MKIELYAANDAEALRGNGPELWLRVMCNEVLDLPRILAALDEEAKATFAGYHARPVAYYPSLSEGDDHDFSHEEWFVFKKRIGA